MDGRAQDGETGIAPQPPAQTQDGPQRRRSSIPSFLIVSFILFMLTSHNGDEFLARHQYQDALQTLTVQLGDYTAWLNGTASNFTMPERDHLVDPLLSSFSVFQPPPDPRFGSYHPNITGFAHGDAKFYNITPSHLSQNDSRKPWSDLAENLLTGVNMSSVVEHLGTWNWAATRKISLSVVEKKPQPVEGTGPVFEDIVLVHGRIELTDVNIAEDLRLEFEGVHFVNNGSIYGFAGPSGKHVDIRLLPSLVPDDRRNDTVSIIAPEMTARISKLKTLIDAGVVDQDMPSGSDENPKSSCPFTVYAQIEPSPIAKFLMQEWEDELQQPTGISTVKSPKLSIGGLMVSKKCGIIYEITNTEGLRSRRFYRKVSTYASLAAITYLILVVLLSRQMERSRTPAGISRLSMWTFLSQSIVDSVSFAGHVTFAILAEGRPSLSLIAPAFLACLLFMYEARATLLIHDIQLHEDPVLLPQSRWMAQPPASATQPESATLPTPVAQPESPPSRLAYLSSVLRYIWSDTQTRPWMTLFILLTLIVRIVLSPSLALAFLAIMYSSFWLTQIVRSVRRGRSSGLSKEYLLGTTVCRLFFALYFLACPKNVLDIEPRPWIRLLAYFMFFQVFVVILQGHIGHAFFLPRKYSSMQTYDYHPVLPNTDPESPEKALGNCAICMDAINYDRPHRSSQSTEGLEQDERRGQRVGGLLNLVQRGVGVTARKDYSLAPCCHLFHTECLEKWLAIKNICPQCRRALPPL